MAKKKMLTEVVEETKVLDESEQPGTLVETEPTVPTPVDQVTITVPALNEVNYRVGL